MNTLFIIIKNGYKLVFSKKFNYFLYFVLPVVVFIVFVFIFSSENPELQIGILDKDNGMISNDLIAEIKSMDNIKIKTITNQDINRMIINKEIDAALAIPEYYTENLKKGINSKVEIITIQGSETSAWIINRIDLFTSNVMKIAEHSKHDNIQFNSLYYSYTNPEVKLEKKNIKDEEYSMNISSIGLGFFIALIFLQGLGVTKNFMKDKQLNTLDRIRISPVPSYQYISGYMITYIIVLLIQIVFTILIVKFIMRIEFFLPLPLLFLICFCFGLNSIGTGLIIVAFTKSSTQAGQITNILFTPACMLGGCYWPFYIMPPFLQRVSDLFPHKWAMDAFYKLQEGGDFFSIILNLSILLGFTLLFVLIFFYKINHVKSVDRFV